MCIYIYIYIHTCIWFLYCDLSRSFKSNRYDMRTALWPNARLNMRFISLPLIDALFHHRI